MKVTVWTVIIGLILFTWFNVVMADSELIRPTSFVDGAARTANESNAYDTDDGTGSETEYETDNTQNFQVGEGPTAGTDAWAANNAPYTSGTISVRYSREGDESSDTGGLYLRDRSDGDVQTILAIGNTAVAQTWWHWSLTSTYLADPDTLRVEVWSEQVGGPDNESIWIYDVKINATYTPSAGRRRMIMQ